MVDEKTQAARRAQDKVLAGLHHKLDLAAQDNRMKYERPSFSIVTASEAFRAGYDRIFAPQVQSLESNPERDKESLACDP